MANLGPQHINLTYGGLLQLPSGSITSILQTVTDGFGNATGLQISSTGVAGTIISSSVLITGGSIDGTPIGATTPSTGKFTNLTVTGTTTLATSLSGILKGTSGVVSVASAGSDYVSPAVLAQPNGVATLDSSGLLPVSQLPPIAIVQYLGVVSSQAAMLALVGQQGDWCTRSDLGANFVITGPNPSLITSWTELSYPTAPVTSVNGLTGAVTLSYTNVGASPATTGNSILYANGLGGFSNVTVGTGLGFVGGTLSVTGGYGTVSSFSFTNANGFTGIVTNATTTPALSLGTSITGVLKGNGTAISAAVSGTDYAPATTGTAILKGNGSGGFSSAVANTDYQSVITATGLLKGAGSGSISAAVVGTDYAPATTGSSILYGNSLGGFSNVTIGSNLTFSGGTLSATNSGGTVTTVSVVSANGFAGTVANATTTPAITLSTSVTGLLKGNGTAISAATAGTDYAAATTGTSSQLLANNGSGGFANVTVGTGLSLSAGTLSATNAGSVTAVTASSPLASSGGTAPNITIQQASATQAGYLSSADWTTFNSKGSGTVTSVTGTSPIVSSGGATPSISLATGYGDTQNPYASKTANFVLAAPNGTAGAPSFRALVSSDIPALNYVSSVSGTAPISVTTGLTPTVSIQQASSTQSGYLSSTDWNTFNSKGSGSLTSVSVASANGFSGTSSGGTTPSLTLATSVTGLLKGNGTAISAAVSGTDYAPATSGTSILYGNGSGGFSNVSIGTNLTFSSGVLSATSSTSTVGSPGYYGSFYDTTTQTVASTTTAYVIGINSTALNNGVSITSSNRITFAYAGIYNIQYSIQLVNSDTVNHEANIWFRQNGTDIADSNTQVTVPGSHGGINGAQCLCVNLFVNAAANDYVQLVWQADNTSVSIATFAAGSSPTIPVTPGVIVTAMQQTQIGIGYYGLTSSTSTTIGTGSLTFTTNLSATSTAFIVGSRVRLAYAVTPSNFVEGVITSFSGTTLVVNVDNIGGSGTYANWNVSIAGSFAVTSGTSILKGNGAGGITNAVGGTDYQTAQSVTGIVKSSGTTRSAAVAGTDYSAGTASLTTGIVKSTTTTGALSIAVSGTDYAPATTGSSILYGNGAGGFSSVTIGTGVSFSGGTLSATGSGGTVTAVTATTPLASTGGTAPNLTIQQASGTQSGYLSSTDWTTFNNKQAAGTYVTSISVASSNGLAGTSSGGATPTLTLSTSVTGLLKGNGTAISAAVSGTDYAPATSGTSILKGNGLGGFSNAVSGTDYAPATSGTSILYGSGSGGFSNVTVGTGLSFSGGTLSATGGGGSVTITNDTTTSTFEYPLFANATSGTVSTVYTSNANYLYKPSTGELQAPEVIASNGLIVNSATVSATYSIPSGSNAMSAGPVSIASGQTVTVPSGSVWVVI